MNKRPELTKDLDSAASRRYYYLKREIADFGWNCGLSVSGGELELTDRIAYFFDTGKVLQSSAEQEVL